MKTKISDLAQELRQSAAVRRMPVARVTGGMGETTPESPEMKIDASKWPPMLTDMVGVAESTFRQMGRDENQSMGYAIRVVLALAEFFGGRIVYIPKGDRLKIALRDIEIASRMGREKADALAEEYGMSLQHVYQICRKQNALRRNARVSAFVAATNTTDRTH